jgi:hypothetical protein
MSVVRCQSSVVMIPFSNGPRTTDYGQGRNELE